MRILKDLKSNTEKFLLSKVRKEKQRKKKVHPLWSYKKTYPSASFGLIEREKKIPNSFKSNKIKRINEEDKCQTTEVNGRREILPLL